PAASQHPLPQAGEGEDAASLARGAGEGGRRSGEGDAVLRDVDLTVAPGEIVAVVGGSGAGKSTLVNLLPRFYDVNSGRITIDGRDIREATLTSLRALMGLVTQEVILFNDSVRNNIACGRGDAEER